MAAKIAESGISFANGFQTGCKRAGLPFCQSAAGTSLATFSGNDLEAVMNDLFNLQRFVDAQNPLFETVTSELETGKKRTHWMWFVFPQIQGLGHSDMARRYAISSVDEARAYLDHPVLGERLRVLTQIVNALEGRSVEQIFGYPDDLKFHSSMTLFAHAAVDKTPFELALNTYFGGEPDAGTVARLK
jgi:uncharacterized protein (DUF1810 family)